jgi:flagellar motor switch protein FliM
MVHDNFARLVSNYLTASLRTSVQIKVLSTEQTTFEEFIRSIPNPTILISYYLRPFEGLMMFETGPQYVFQVIDILFGGHGNSSYKTREFTEIEKNIIKKINWKLLENMKFAWEDIIEVEPVFEGLETNPALNQFMAPNEPVVLVTMDVEIFGQESFINVCIPYISIEKYMDKFIIQYKTLSTSKNEISSSKIANSLMSVNVNSIVELGSSTITIEDFLNLSVGDCLMLNQKISEPINYYIEDSLHYKVYAGTVNNKKLGVQISEILYKDVDNDE